MVRARVSRGLIGALRSASCVASEQNAAQAVQTACQSASVSVRSYAIQAQQFPGFGTPASVGSVTQFQQTRGHAAAAAAAASLAERHREIQKCFPTAVSADDFLARVEIALAGYGFTGDNTIAMSNLCRDESCMVLEDKLESAFGSCFSTHGLGGVLTCGVIGIKAGLSHSPVQGGKERYVFFSMPHIAIDSEGKIGAVSRPNRPGASAACGALIAALGDLKKEGVDVNCKSPGEHDPLEPEYSILKQRLARRAKYEKLDPSKMSLVDITALAERVISSDLEHLVSKAVDPKKADYAVFTGVQIHNWAHNLDDVNVPSLEFVGIGKSYVVVDGVKTFIDLFKVPALSPRQIQLLAATSLGGAVTPAAAASAGKTGSMLAEIPRSYLMKRLGGAKSDSTIEAGTGPSWKEYVKTTYDDPHASAPKMDEIFKAPAPPATETVDTSFSWWPFGKK